MTREEAVKAIKSHCYFANLVPVGKEALDMAIEALEQEPTKEEKALLQKWRDNRGISMKDFEDAMDALQQEPCEDAVSRQAAIDIVQHECGEWKGLAKEIVKQFNGLPPVKPQPKTGHWIPTTENWWECSECGTMVYSQTESDKLKFHAFCGRCGRRMIEPQKLKYADADTMMPAT